MPTFKSPLSGSPYRDAPVVARYVCIVCYRSLSTMPGNCPHCYVGRLELARPEVRQEVRAFAEKRLQSRKRREEIALGGIGLGIGFSLVTAVYSLVFNWEVGGAFAIRLFVICGMAVGVAIASLLTRLYVRLKPDSAIAAFAARRVRISRELGVDVKVGANEQPHSGPSDAPPDDVLARNSTAVDPELADIAALLQSIGAKLE